ncbi:GntR family transcriptional regulator [Niallia circulans]|jgi:GntR family transcriptional regulator, rspAB operon transcriptional repressor|nr:GntR family transcriptional regulator [Niallia circulans]
MSRKSKRIETIVSIDVLKDKLRPIQNSLVELNLPEQAYQVVRHAIRELTLAPGVMLLERELANVLDMSRTPIREALVRLQTEGLLTLVPRRGFAIAPIDKKDLAEIYEVAEVLDGLACEAAAKKVTSQDINTLNQLLEEQINAISNSDVFTWAELDDQFHKYIAEIVGNRRLLQTIQSTEDHLYRARLYTVDKRPIPHQSVLEHRGIIISMQIGDALAARTLMQSHRKRAKTEIMQFL